MSTFEKVRDVVAEELSLEPDEITMDSDFREDLGADSLDITSLFVAFEESFGEKIPDDDAVKLKTVGSIVEYIDTHYPQQS